MEKDLQMEQDLQGAFQAFSQGANDNPTEDGAGAQPSNENPNENQQNQNQPDQQGQTKQNAAFAKLRTDNSTMAAKLNAFEASVKKAGYESLDDFIAKTNQAEVQKSAQQQNIPVEVEERLRRLEEENAMYHRNERQAQVQQEAVAVVQKYKPTEAEWKEFVDGLVRDGINVYDKGMHLEALYLQRNSEAIFNKRLEEAKQGWLAEQAKTNSAPTNPPAGTPPATRTPGTPVDFRAIGKNFKK